MCTSSVTLLNTLNHLQMTLVQYKCSGYSQCSLDWGVSQSNQMLGILWVFLTSSLLNLQTMNLRTWGFICTLRS